MDADLDRIASGRCIESGLCEPRGLGRRKHKTTAPSSPERRASPLIDPAPGVVGGLGCFPARGRGPIGGWIAGNLLAEENRPGIILKSDRGDPPAIRAGVEERRPMFTLAIAAALSFTAQSPPPTEVHTLIVEVRELLGDAVVPDLSIKLVSTGSEELRATTDVNGEARFKLSSGSRSDFSLSAGRDGLVPLSYRWSKTADSPTPPGRILLLTEKATVIGGKVLDEEGRPLPDAVVVVSVKKTYPRSKQTVGIINASVRTDAEGRWSLRGAPEQSESIEIAAYHYLCLDEGISYHLRPFRPLASLQDGSAVLRLRRGTRVEGTVLSPDGQPVAKAEVAYGEGRGYANAIPPIKADDEGRFTFGIKPGTIANIISQAPGFGPTLQEVKVGDGTSRVYLTLPQAHSVRGRIVDPSGKPIANALVSLYWSGDGNVPRSYFGSAAARRLKTDGDGRFEWKDSPRGGVRADVTANGFADKNNSALASDLEQQIALIPPTPVSGTVVDRETGAPIEGFSLSLAAAWQEGSPLIWQRGMDLAGEASRAPGSFRTTLSTPAHRYIIRVQADGYFAEDSEAFATDGLPHNLTFRLTGGEPLRGTISHPDGSAVRSGTVHLVPVHREGWIDYLDYPRDVEEAQGQRAAGMRIDPDGRFSIPPQRDNVSLLFLADAGSLLVPSKELRGQDRLVLQPWARVAGRVTIDGKPARKIRLDSYDPDEPAPVEGEPRLSRRYWAETDDEGRFQLDRILPGRLILSQSVLNGVQGRRWPIIRASLDVVGGQTYDLKIGESGRVVTGRVQLPPDDVWMIRKAEIVPRGVGTGTAERVGVEVLEQGRLRALDVRPGAYTLQVAIHEPPPTDACGWGRLLGEFRQDFTVPVGAHSGEGPLDLGVLEPISTGGRPLQVGDVAPDFQLRTLDGHDLKLADLRGKFVLLDIWATWCAPCVSEMPNLLRVHQEFSADGRFAVIGINVDERASDVAAMVKSMKLAWPQGLAGPDSPVSAEYGATAIPATFLIGPDGRIIAKDLRGEAIRKAVVEILR
ncbi:carboxypeptidase regulatory-like domain-containing protein [Tundrisphaera sp. TA3]|uniref:carboxypeptidase regulatory-like domain-containing protein n=1 Tax=Tundrisphaera sp. TA3 TaxID=3435775 RepID=UPI003EC0C64B